MKQKLLLKACAVRLARKRRWSWIPGMLGGLKMRMPRWVAGGELERIYRLQSKLLHKGRLVWGHLVQSNVELFRQGRGDAPADVVFQLSDDQNLDFLRELSRALFRLKGTQPVDSDARKIADHLTAETTPAFGLEIPAGLDSKKQCRMSTIMVCRKHLPAGKLNGNYFPLLVLEDESCVAMVLPSSLWPVVMQYEWELPKPRLTPGLLFGYLLVALFYLPIGMFLGALLNLTADGKLIDYLKEHPVGVVMALMCNIVGVFILKCLKTQTDDLPGLELGDVVKSRWYQIGTLPITDRVAFLLWFIAYLIGLIAGIVFGM